MITPEQRRRVIQTIWRRAPSLSLRSRMESLRRAQQLVMLGRILDRISADAADMTQGGLSPVVNTTLGNLGHNSDAGSQRMTKKVDLRKLLQKVEAAPSGSPELDSEFVREQILNPHNLGDR